MICKNKRFDTKLNKHILHNIHILLETYCLSYDYEHNKVHAVISICNQTAFYLEN